MSGGVRVVQHKSPSTTRSSGGGEHQETKQPEPTEPEVLRNLPSSD